MKEVRREEAAIAFIKSHYKDALSLSHSKNVEVTSSWGPYTTTAGTAKCTIMPGTKRET